MNLHHRPHARRFRGSIRALSLLEVLVYMSILSLIFLLSYEAYYRTEETVRRMTRNADDIMNAQRSGESWRSAIRLSTGEISLSESNSSRSLTIPGTNGPTVFSFHNSGIWRLLPGQTDPHLILPNVLNSRWVRDPGTPHSSWRWELELKPTSKHVRYQPLFSFLAPQPPTRPTPHS